MRPAFRHAIPAIVLAFALLSTGCGATSHLNGAAQPGPPPSLSLATAITTSAGTWAVVVAGGSAANHNNFWQLLARPADSSTWRLATPPGVASNGGLVVAPGGSQSLAAAFRPSQGLVFTPLATTSDLGQHWTAGILDAALASSPSALASDPSTGHMLALLARGTVEQSSNRGTTWAPFTTQRSVSASTTGRACHLQRLTAVAVSGAGTPLVAGSCTRPGSTPIFGYTNGAWQEAGPPPPPAAADGPITVLAMITVAAGRTLAVLEVGTGRAGVLIVAWSRDRSSAAGGWLLSPPLRLRGNSLLSVSAGSDGSVVLELSHRTGSAETRPGAIWRPLPELPARTQALASGPGTAIEAIAPAGSAIIIWSSAGPGGTWTRQQDLAVPIQYGSSG